jgi:hypothetical protein
MERYPLKACKIGWWLLHGGLVLFHLVPRLARRSELRYQLVCANAAGAVTGIESDKYVLHVAPLSKS